MVTFSTLTEVCKRLNEAKVKYVVIGGFAIILHGFQRATKDIDLLIETSRENVVKIKTALRDILPEACAELAIDDVQKYTVVRMSGENLLVDLMEKVGDIDFSKSTIIEEEIDGIKIPVADLDTMLKLKKGLRERDQQDLIFLEGKKRYLKEKK